MYGKLIAKFGKTTGPNGTGLVNRVLEIYEIKTGLKGVLWDSSFIGWKSKPNEPISVAKFRYKDNDATIYRVKEYFNFSEQNSHKME
jgi:hypothetical protein